jgi:hypothetical protein
MINFDRRETNGHAKGIGSVLDSMPCGICLTTNNAIFLKIATLRELFLANVPTNQVYIFSLSSGAIFIASISSTIGFK